MCLRANGAQAAVRVAGLIGEGRFGRVLLAMREDSGELLAVKEVSLHELGDGHWAAPTLSPSLADRHIEEILFLCKSIFVIFSFRRKTTGWEQWMRSGGYPE